MPCPNVIFINPSDSGLTFCSSKKKIFNTSIAPQFYHLHNISSGVPFAFLATLLYDVMTGHIAMLCPFSFSSRLSCLIPPLRNLGIWSLSNQRQHLHMPLGLRVSLDAYIHGSPSMNAALMYVITPKIPTSHPRMVASFEVLSTRSHTLICAPRLEGILGVCLKYDLHYERTHPTPFSREQQHFLYWNFNDSLDGCEHQCQSFSAFLPLLIFEYFLYWTKHVPTLLFYFYLANVMNPHCMTLCTRLIRLCMLFRKVIISYSYTFSLHFLNVPLSDLDTTEATIPLQFRQNCYL